MFIRNLIQKILYEVNPKGNFKNILSNIRKDILAGITVGIIALPLALAFGEMSLLGPDAGIWGAIIGGVIGGIFGGCIISVSGPTAPTSSQIAILMTGFIVSSSGQSDIDAIFSIIFLSGLIIISFSFLNISKFIHYIPYSVVAGFMCGIGIIVILSQIKSFLGIHLFSEMENFDQDTLLISIPSLFIMFFWKRIKLISEILDYIPAPLVSLIFGSAIVYFLNLNIPLIGDRMIGSEQASLFALYKPDFTRFREFILPALSLAGLVSIDSLLTCKIADNMIGGKHRSNQEVFGQGFANMLCGLFGGAPTATATMFTVSNIKFGAKTVLSSIVYGFTLFAILFGFKFLVESIPLACIAAILFKIGFDIMDYRILPILKRLPLSDILIFAIVLLITVFGDLIVAVGIGVIIASLIQIKNFRLKYSHKFIHISESGLSSKSKKTEIFSKMPVYVLEPNGTLFFGSIQSLLNSYDLNIDNDLLLVDLANVDEIDLTSAFAIEDFINVLNHKKVKVNFLNVKSNVFKILEKLKLNEKFEIKLDQKLLFEEIVQKYD